MQKDSITVCLDLSEALSGEKPNKRFTEVLRIAAMEIALKECDEPGEVDQYADGIVLDLTEFLIMQIPFGVKYKSLTASKTEVIRRKKA